MTIRNPLVIVAGEIAELPAGDTITGAGSGGSSGALPSLLGVFPGQTAAQVGTTRYYPRNDITITQIFSFTSGVVTTDVVADVCVNGVVKQRIIIPAGASIVTTLISIPVRSTDYITINIVSGIGQDLSLRLDY